MDIETIEDGRYRVTDVEGIYATLIIEGDYTPEQRGSVKHFIEPIDADFEITEVDIELKDGVLVKCELSLVEDELIKDGFYDKVLKAIDDNRAA